MNNIKQLFKQMIFCLLIIQSSHASEIVVNSTQTLNPFADDGWCTLPEAIEAANNNQPSGTLAGECLAGDSHPVIDNIVFELDILPAVFAVETALNITESINISGPHKDLLTITGIGLDRVIEITGALGQQFILTDLTITGGYAPAGVPPISVGGGMMITLFEASITLERLRFENNNAEYAGGALAIGYGGTQNNETNIIQSEFFNNSSIGSSTQGNGNHGGGGAIFIGGYQTVTIKQSTFSENSARSTAAPLPSGDGMGGAIWMLSSNAPATSSLEIDSCTFDDNEAYGAGGAISIGGPGFPADESLVNIKHATITNNKADANQSDTGDAGGGIYSSASNGVNIFNTVVARNQDFSTSSRPNFSGTFNSIGHNYTNGQTTGFPFGMPNANNDFVAAAAATPGLELLSDNGGPTLTRAIQSGSILIDQGRCSQALTDQRGFNNELQAARIHDDKNVNDLDDGCDIGAYERGTSSENLMPETLPNLYAVLEDQSLVVTDADGNQTPGELNDNGLLWNDSDNDVLWITNAGTLELSSLDMPDAGEIELLVDGTFTYTPPVDAFGDAAGSYLVSDRFNVVEEVFGIQVFPVNDAPSFTANGSVSFNFSDFAQAVSYQDWATDINAGAANENDQALTFYTVYQQGDDSFFDVPPAIDEITGTLSFDINDAADGSVVLMVYLSDDGGTDFGGADTSAGIQITISRTPTDVIFKNSFEVISES